MEKKKIEEMKKRNIIATIVGVAILAVIAVVVFIVININKISPIDDDYFMSDDTKLVIDVDGDKILVEAGGQRPVMAYKVYYYTGDDVNDMKVFFEYTDDEQAKTADGTMGDGYKEWAENKKINGKYIVFDVKKSQYDGIKTSDVRQMMEEDD